VRAPVRRLNPSLWRRGPRCGIPKSTLWLIRGFRHYSNVYAALTAENVRATPLNVERLQRVADAVQFPRDDPFP
jgi:hypothetical protein